MREIIADPKIHLFIRSLLALMLLSAGAVKMSNWSDFSAAVRNYKLIPEGLASIVARLVPVVEVLVALCLMYGALSPWPNLMAACLFLLFAGAVAVNLLRGRRNISCGCFGTEQGQGLSWMLVLRNFLLAGLAILPVISPAATGMEKLANEETLATVAITFLVFALWLLLKVVNGMWRLSGDLGPFSSAKTVR